MKTITEDGKYKYSAVRRRRNDDLEKKYHAVFVESLISVDYAGNTVAILCHTGMANAACAALDTMGFEGIVGTLAGDDTIFILMRTEQLAEELTHKIQKIMNS